MDSVVTLADVANIVTFIAPGYFAIQVYSLIYAKRDRDFSRLLIESVVYSLPIVAAANLIWEVLPGRQPVTGLSLGYVLLLLILALLAGLTVTLLRNRAPAQNIARKLGIDSPNEDFVKAQLLRIDPRKPDKNAVAAKLKSGQVFSGTVDRLSRYDREGPKYFYFANLAWYNPKTKKWEEREGGLLVERSEIEYIETPKLKD